MPVLPDKVLLNHGGCRGMNKLIEEDFRSLILLCEEIRELGLTAGTVDFRDKMKTMCATHYKAQMKYHEGLRELIDEVAKMIDDHVLAQPPSQTP